MRLCLSETAHIQLPQQLESHPCPRLKITVLRQLHALPHLLTRSGRNETFLTVNNVLRGVSIRE